MPNSSAQLKILPQPASHVPCPSSSSPHPVIAEVSPMAKDRIEAIRSLVFILFPSFLRAFHLDTPLEEKVSRALEKSTNTRFFAFRGGMIYECLSVF
jgi:hypothetical protein